MSRMTVSTIVNHIITAHEQEGRTEFVLFAPMEMAALVESELNMLYSTLYATKAPNTTVAIGPLGGSESIYGTISMLVGDVESAKHLASLQSPLVLSVDEFTTKDLSLALVEMASQGLIRHYHLSGEVENPQHKKYDADIVGIDIETGGLNGYVTLESGERVHGALYYPILEVGIVLPLVDAHTGHCDVTNGKRLVVGLYPSEDVLERCHEWAVKQHTKSGLIDALRSGEGFDYVASTAQDMENYITEWLDLNGVRKFNSKEASGAIALGSNVSFDMEFIGAQMPELAKLFSYRKMDVSAINCFARSIWSDLRMPLPTKKQNHTALSDIAETFDELNAYTSSLFKGVLGA